MTTGKIIFSVPYSERFHGLADEFSEFEIRRKAETVSACIAETLYLLGRWLFDAETRIATGKCIGEDGSRLSFCPRTMLMSAIRVGLNERESISHVSLQTIDEPNDTCTCVIIRKGHSLRINLKVGSPMRVNWRGEWPIEGAPPYLAPPVFEMPRVSVDVREEMRATV